ncbi:hypothetical protein Tco_0649632 [Tanacetum coccineum]
MFAVSYVGAATQLRPPCLSKDPVPPRGKRPPHRMEVRGACRGCRVSGRSILSRLRQATWGLSVFPTRHSAGAASEWFKKDCIGLVTTWENLIEKFVPKFYQLSDNNEEMEVDEDDDPNDIVEIFKIEGNLFDYETPLCKAFNDFNYLLKIDMDLFTFDIQGIKTYEEYELNNNITGDLEEPWLANGADEKLKAEALMHKAKVEESWGDATPRVMKFCAWLKIRRFEMIKYSFDTGEEYVAIKEHECSDHSKANIDACQAYRELFRIMDEGWLVTKACEE